MYFEFKFCMGLDLDIINICQLFFNLWKLKNYNFEFLEKRDICSLWALRLFDFTTCKLRLINYEYVCCTYIPTSELQTIEFASAL